MLPIRDDNPQLKAPLATYTIIALNALAWVFLQGMGQDPQLSLSICRLGLIPGELLGLATAGASAPGLCRLGEADWSTTVTSMFMHGGWFHILGNMWFLWIFGDNVEDAMGRARFVVFYLLCGLGAAGLQVIADPSSTIPMVGASGAIGGVMGAYVLLYPKVNVHLLLLLGFYATTIAVPAVFMLGYWLLLQLIGGVTSIGAQGGGVAFWAHVGGFVAGAALVFLFRDTELLKRHPYHGWQQGKAGSRRWRRIDRNGR